MMRGKVTLKEVMDRCSECEHGLKEEIARLEGLLGGEKPDKCEYCGGTGVITVSIGNAAGSVTCIQCDGSGVSRGATPDKEGGDRE